MHGATIRMIWNKKPTRCHLVYFISTYQLLNMFRATMCPSSGADDLVVFSLPCGVVPWLCRHSHGTTPHGRENTNKSSAPEDGHMVARNMLSNDK